MIYVCLHLHQVIKNYNVQHFRFVCLLNHFLIRFFIFRPMMQRNERKNAFAKEFLFHYLNPSLSWLVYSKYVALGRGLGWGRGEGGDGGSIDWLIIDKKRLKRSFFLNYLAERSELLMAIVPSHALAACEKLWRKHGDVHEWRFSIDETWFNVYGVGVGEKAKIYRG